ncbi:MAG: HAD-IIA family hydrolase [Christensenellales bacterium]
MKNLKEISVYLFDMDGTLNMGERPIDGAMETLKMLTEAGKTVCFVTNNSSKSKYDYLNKVRRMGYNADIKQIITSGMAAASYINKHYAGKKVYVLGTETLCRELKESGLDVVGTGEDADIILLAFDTELTYAKLWHATNLVAAGKTYIATHPDFVCPSDNGNMPDAGAMMALVEKTTGKTPEIIIGKPYAPMAEYVFDFCSVTPDKVAFVGDRLYTDIKFALNNDMTGILVLSGETDLAMLKESGLNPDYVFDDVNALREYL